MHTVSDTFIVSMHHKSTLNRLKVLSFSHLTIEHDLWWQ